MSTSAASSGSGSGSELARPAELVASGPDDASLTRLFLLYAVAVDERDWSTLRLVFASGARIDYSKSLGPTGPIEEILPWMEANLSWEALPRCQHMLSNVCVSVEGNEGRGRADYLNADVFAFPDGEHSLVVHSGVYRAAFRRDSTTWQITELQAELYWRHEPPSDTVTFLFQDHAPQPGSERG